MFIPLWSRVTSTTCSSLLLTRPTWVGSKHNSYIATLMYCGTWSGSYVTIGVCAPLKGGHYSLPEEL